MMFGLLLIVGLMGKSVVKGLIAVFIGLLLSLIGQDPATGAERFLFNQLNLLDGIDFLVLAMGLFGVSEIFLNAEQSMNIAKPPKVKGLIPPRDEWGPATKAIGRGTALGMALGLVPGSSASIASLLSYSLEKRVSKDPSRFGKGAIEGVAGPETANNSYAGAALIPLFTLGIPSSPTGDPARRVHHHGLIPGPAHQKNPTSSDGHREHVHRHCMPRHESAQANQGEVPCSYKPLAPPCCSSAW
jgi:putative tricarboxylic transport membrane protein